MYTFNHQEPNYWAIYSRSEQNRQYVGCFSRETGKCYVLKLQGDNILSEANLLSILAKLIELNEEITVYI